MSNIKREMMRQELKRHQKESGTSSGEFKRFFATTEFKPTLFNKCCMAFDLKELFR